MDKNTRQTCVENTFLFLVLNVQTWCHKWVSRPIKWWQTSEWLVPLGTGCWDIFWSSGWNSHLGNKWLNPVVIQRVLHAFGVMTWLGLWENEGTTATQGNGDRVGLSLGWKEASLRELGVFIVYNWTGGRGWTEKWTLQRDEQGSGTWWYTEEQGASVSYSWCELCL